MSLPPKRNHMQASWTIDVDPVRNLVRIRISGFFTAADIAAFKLDRDAAHRRLTCEPNQHLTLTDVSGMRIQPQDIVHAFKLLLADKRQQSRKLAFITGSSLARLQLLRASENRRARLFTNADDAEAWLFAADADEQSNRAA